ncbi:hypothetical protein AF332_11720 [Sporosarcina globispora]|uniref:Uncharacterized protein n=1 Tax=Sporosarcina globispora TaxID=1459 RepID=A0A0M0GCE1_SPOGL|nr:hypothetical protein [Sporosarcina globispora]KON87428.1 hypothetical protein AF332_11720 [Sporosarcina globispora]
MNELKVALDSYFEFSPKAKEIKDWAGCNYYVNRGNNDCEPIGTATSMHDCLDCERIDYCKIKMSAPIWEINDERVKELNKKWREMHSK